METRALPSALLPGLRSFASASVLWRSDVCAALEAALHADARLPWDASSPLSKEDVLAPPVKARAGAGAGAGAGASAGAGAGGSAGAAAGTPVILFVGAFGSGKSRIARALATLNSGERTWHVVAPDSVESSVAPWTLDDVTVRLERAAAEVATGSSKPAAVALVVPANTPTPDAAAMATAGCCAVPPLYLRTVVACVNTRGCFLDARGTQWIPYVRATCTRGFVQHVALMGCDKASDDRVSAIRSAIHQTNPEASVLHLNGGLAGPIPLSMDAISSLMGRRTFDGPQLHALRSLSCPGWMSRTAPTPRPLAASAVFKETVTLHRARLEEFLLSRVSFQVDAVCVCVCVCVFVCACRAVSCCLCCVYVLAYWRVCRRHKHCTRLWTATPLRRRHHRRRRWRGG